MISRIFILVDKHLEIYSICYNMKGQEGSTIMRGSIFGLLFVGIGWMIHINGSIGFGYSLVVSMTIIVVCEWLYKTFVKR